MPQTCLYACHRSEDHGKPLYLQNRDEIVATAGSITNDTLKASTNKKLSLTNSMKTSLLRMEMFTEEQAEDVTQEAQNNLPRDF